MDTSTLTAGGTITLDTFNPSALADSPLQFLNANLSADVIRARGYSGSGDSLLIDGSTFNASTMLKLYGEGAGTVRFRNTVQLNTPLAIIAGQTVIVDPGGNVQITGQGRIYTDNAKFNTPSQGTIQATGSLSTSPHANRPSF